MLRVETEGVEDGEVIQLVAGEFGVLSRHVLDHEFRGAEQLGALLAAVFVRLLLLDVGRRQSLGLFLQVSSSVVRDIDLLDEGTDLQIEGLNPSLVIALRREGVSFAGWPIPFLTLFTLCLIAVSVLVIVLGVCSVAFVVVAVPSFPGILDACADVTDALAVQLLGE